MSDMFDTLEAEVAGRVIGELRQQVARLEGRLALPGVA